MKKLFTMLLIFSIATGIFSQAPGKMSYQAVVRNSSDALVTNTQIGMQISILQGSSSGAAVYVETQTPTTNVNGLVSIEIGVGTALIGDITSIDWANGPYFIKTETDPGGGANYTIAGTSQLLSVPYALHSKTAESLIGTITENDPLFNAWDKTTGISLTESQISDLGTYVETESDPVFTSSMAAKVTETDMVNLSNLSGKNTGDQDISEIEVNTVAIKDIAAKIDELAPVATSGNYADLSNQPNIADSISKHGFDGQYSSLTGTPTNVSSFNNDAGYLTEYIEDDPSVPSGTQAGEMQYWDGSQWITVAAGNEGQVLTIVGGVPTWSSAAITIAGPTDAYNTTTNKVWMDRNLGATQVATSSTDANSYGHLYQWGRATDGHQVRTSGTTSTLSIWDIPGHANFILTSSSPYDWRSSQNDNLWQGVSGVNNPCPSGYRLPTYAEWNAERLSWSTNNAAGAFASPLKLPVAGFRSHSNGSLSSVGSYGYYWSSTVNGTSSRDLDFYSSFAAMRSYTRASGYSVRCIKD